MKIESPFVTLNWKESFSAMTLDHIDIHGLRVDCIIGLYPHEREIPQPVEVDISMGIALEEAARRQDMGFTVDYAQSTAALRLILEKCRFQMLETAAYALLKFLLAPPPRGYKTPQVERAELSIRKPSALGGVAIPKVTLRRDAAWARPTVENKTWGNVEVIHESADSGIYRLNIAPGHAIPPHYHSRMHEIEMVLTQGLLCQNIPTPPGAVFDWPLQAVHRWDNPSEEWQSILCIDMPRFQPDDEIEDDGELIDIAPSLDYVSGSPL